MGDTEDRTGAADEGATDESAVDEGAQQDAPRQWSWMAAADRDEGTGDEPGGAADEEVEREQQDRPREWAWMSDRRPDGDGGGSPTAGEVATEARPVAEPAEEPDRYVRDERRSLWRRALRGLTWPFRALAGLGAAVGRGIGRLLAPLGHAMLGANAVLDRAGRAILRLAGRPWVLVIGLVNIMVLVAGLAFLLAPDSPPLLPYLPVAGVEEVEEPVLDRDRGILFVPVDGGYHAFDASEQQPRYCPLSGHLESEDGRVWSLRGEPLDGGAPLREYPLVVHEDTIYLNLRNTEPAPSGSGERADPACT